MANGEIGIHGVLAVSHVMVVKRLELAIVTTHHHSMKVILVLVLIQRTQNVTTINVQVSILAMIYINCYIQMNNGVKTEVTFTHYLLVVNTYNVSLLRLVLKTFNGYFKLLPNNIKMTEI